MHSSYAQKSRDNHSRTDTARDVKQEGGSRTTLRSFENRPTAVAQRNLQATLNESPKAQSLVQLQQTLNQSPRVAALAHLSATIQRKPAAIVQRLNPDEEELQMKAEPDALQRQALEEEELLQGKFAPVQRQEETEEEELLQGKFEAAQRQGAEEEKLLQGKFAPASAAPVQATTAAAANRTGMPDQLKAGIEALSWTDMSEVRVHASSEKPAQLGALAYTQGHDIHLAPGQEKHIAHEAWHVVQQRQGRVKPTMQMEGAAINDDAGLEREADVMGEKALQLKVLPQAAHHTVGVSTQAMLASSSANVIQGVFEYQNFDESTKKFEDLYNGLQGSKNKYLQFLKSDLGGVIIKLDATDDKNPGDANILIRKEEEGKWSAESLESWRKLDTIYGIGAEVNIRKWFYDKYPSGRILSMVAHEIGVHIVPYMDELMSKLPSKLLEEKEDVSEKVIDTSKQHGPKGRKDHLRVADVEHEDFELYKGVVTDMMASMIKYNMPEVGKEKAGDLADAYLMDLSTFTESGGRYPVPLNPFAIAKKYNDYQKVAKLKPAPKKKTATDVMSDYVSLYSKVYPVVRVQHPVAIKRAEAVAVVLALCLIYYFIRLFM